MLSIVLHGDVWASCNAATMSASDTTGVLSSCVSHEYRFVDVALDKTFFGENNGPPSEQLLSVTHVNFKRDTIVQ